MKKGVAGSSIVMPCMILALLMVLGVATRAGADPPGPPSSDPVDSRVTSGSAIKAFIDPETGALRAPTEEELREIEAMAPQGQPAARTAPRMYYREDGSVAAYLGTSFVKPLVVRRGPDGRMVMGHGSAEQPVHSGTEEDR